MPIPEGMSDLEPDFFPVLLKEIRSNAVASPSFAAKLETARASITRLIARLESISDVAGPKDASDGPPVAAREGSGTEIIGGVLIVLLYVSLYNWFHGNKKK